MSFVVEFYEFNFDIDEILEAFPGPTIMFSILFLFGKIASNTVSIIYYYQNYGTLYQLVEDCSCKMLHGNADWSESLFDG